MAATATNVSAAKPKTGGALYVAPLGTTLPTDASTALASAFTCLGYLGEDGVKENMSMSSAKIKAFGGDEVLNINQGKSEEFTHTLLEVLDLNVMKEVYGPDNVTGTLSTGITVKSNNSDLPEHVLVYELVLRGGVLRRIVIPQGKVTAVGEISYNESGAIGYATTISTSPDSSGNYKYEYTKQPTTTGSGGSGGATG